jgi:hypothetical protein
MTIDKFGRIMPIHGEMLRLIGYRIAVFETTLEIPDRERMNIIVTGRMNLCLMTDVDWEYDLSAWRRFLIAHEKHGYTHPYAFTGVDSAVQQATRDKVRASLVSKIHKIERTAIRIPRFGLTTPIQMAMLQLVGYRLSETEAALAIPDDERISNMVMGYRTLYGMTGVNFGFDLARWHKFLVDHEEYNYTYPYGFKLLEQIVQAQQSDEDRVALVSRISL